MPPDLADLEAALHRAVRVLANHIQPTGCTGCPTCDILWLLVAGADDQLARAQAGVILP